MENTTSSLGDSPTACLPRWCVIKNWSRRLGSPPASNRSTPEDEQEFHNLFSDRIESLLDEGKGSCILANPKASIIVEKALKHFDGSRYSLSAFVLMPNHVHVLFKLAEGEDLGKVIHSWKSFSAHEINKALGQEGPVWQEEYYDRIVRGESHFARLLEYICENPAKAGLKDVTVFTGGTPVPPPASPGRHQ
jgi:REP element-mobilizing transposase RayT